MDLELKGVGQDLIENDLSSESFEEGVLTPDLGVRSKTSLRINYEAQVHVIKGQLGGLEKVRLELGLSQRKVSQLLMVDPSSWTRWTKLGDEAPPHIWRALQWYMSLREKIPGLTPHYFTGTNPQVLHQKALSELDSERTQRLQDQALLQRKIDALAAQRHHLESDLQRMKKDLKFHRKMSIFFLILSLSWAALLILGKIR